MFAALLIGLREGLEAALVIGIIVSYLVRLKRRDALPWVWWGVAISAAISLGVGAFLTFGTAELSDVAEEILAGTLSILAVALVTWMVVWMANTSKTMSKELRENADKSLAKGKWSVALLAALSVGREGIETTLFLWSSVQAAGKAPEAIIGGTLGLGLAAAMGYGIYRGTLKINLSRFFLWSGVTLIVIAAGVLAYGIHDLQEAGVLPGAEVIAYDLSETIPVDTWYGTLLKGVFSFTPETSVLSFWAWWLYVVLALWVFVRISRPTQKRK